jgi:hypothetical protein
MITAAFSLPRITHSSRPGYAALIDAHTAPPLTPAIPIDPKMVVAVGLGIFALWQLAQGRILPPALTLGWYAAKLTGILSNGDSSDGGE